MDEVMVMGTVAFANDAELYIARVVWVLIVYGEGHLVIITSLQVGTEPKTL
jgi:hypothetical protein